MDFREDIAEVATLSAQESAQCARAHVEAPRDVFGRRRMALEIVSDQLCDAGAQRDGRGRRDQHLHVALENRGQRRVGVDELCVEAFRRNHQRVDRSSKDHPLAEELAVGVAVLGRLVSEISSHDGDLAHGHAPDHHDRGGEGILAVGRGDRQARGHFVLQRRMLAVPLETKRDLVVQQAEVGARASEGLAERAATAGQVFDQVHHAIVDLPSYVQTDLVVSRGHDGLAPELHRLLVGNARAGGAEILAGDSDRREDRCGRKSAPFEVRDQRQDQTRRKRDVRSRSSLSHADPRLPHRAHLR